MTTTQREAFELLSSLCIEDGPCGKDGACSCRDAIAQALLAGQPSATEKSEIMFALGYVLKWWGALPSSLRAAIELGHGEPNCIAKARHVYERYGKSDAVEDGQTITDPLHPRPH